MAVAPNTVQELRDMYSDEIEKIQNAPSIGEGDGQIRAMSMNELRRWYDKELDRLILGTK